MASESASTTTDVGSTSALTIREIIPTNRTPEVWKDFNMCIMTNGQKKAQCKYCFHFLSEGSNTTLKNHITHPHCEVLKAQQNQNPEAGKTSMGRDGQIFMYNPDYLREQFAGLVIQRGLPFNHFDHEQTTRVFQNTMQPRYTHGVVILIAFDIKFITYQNKRQGMSYNSSEYEQYLKADFGPSILHPKEFATFDVLGFWKAKENQFPILSRMAMDILSVLASFGKLLIQIFQQVGRCVEIPKNKTNSGVFRDVHVLEGSLRRSGA
ncbi:zinc finger, BED-type, phospholipase-like, homeodomain-like protein [Tanacetum coccineum]